MLKACKLLFLSRLPIAITPKPTAFAGLTSDQKEWGGGGAGKKRHPNEKNKTKPKTCPFSREQKYWCMCSLEYKLFFYKIYRHYTPACVFFFIFLVSFIMVTMGGD